MPISIDDLKALAKEHCDSSDESEIRISLHKSYYCAYHACLESLGATSAQGWVGGIGGTHKQLRDVIYYEHSRPIAFILDELKKQRHKADYDLSETLTKSEAKGSLNLLDSLLEKLKQNPI